MQLTIDGRELQSVFIGNVHERVFRTVKVYADRILRGLKEEDTTPTIWFVIVPDDIYKYCRPESRVEAAKVRLTTLRVSPKLGRKLGAEGLLFGELLEDATAYQDEPNFHNQLKARLLSQAPIQIIRESTIAHRDFLNSFGRPTRNLDSLQPNIAWNISTTAFYKAGGRPWKMAEIRKGVCYIGLVFKQDKREDDPRSACCAAQMFLDSGDGIVFKGAARWQRSPEMNRPIDVQFTGFLLAHPKSREVFVVPTGASLRLLCAQALICGAVICYAQTYSTSVSSTSGQSVPAGNAVNPYSGSVPTKIIPGTIPLSLQDAINLGLKNNLGLLLSRADTRAARGQRWQELSALLPHVTAAPYAAESKINLAELGIGNVANTLHISTAVGPFSYFDARAAVSQRLFDWKSINAARAATQSVKSADYTVLDAHDLIVLDVGYAYFQAVADEARIATDEAQVAAAQAVFDQATDQVKAGTAPDIDALRTKVELQTRQQELIQARNDFDIQKITVARVIGLAPGQQFDLTDKSPYQPLENVTIDGALQRAYASRSDYRAAMSDVRAAELSRKAAAAGYLPSLSFDANYGTGGAHPSDATRVYDVRGTLSIPIFTGNSVHGDIQQADARLEQARERLDNLRGQIEADVRAALLNLQSSAAQVKVAQNNIDLADQTLTQSRDRFSAGVTDTVEVVQSQETVAAAHEQYISSLYNYNFAKISLIRALGAGERGVKEYFSGK